MPVNRRGRITGSCGADFAPVGRRPPSGRVAQHDTFGDAAPLEAHAAGASSSSGPSQKAVLAGRTLSSGLGRAGLLRFSVVRPRPGAHVHPVDGQHVESPEGGRVLPGGQAYKYLVFLAGAGAKVDSTAQRLSALRFAFPIRWLTDATEAAR